MTSVKVIIATIIFMAFVLLVVYIICRALISENNEIFQETNLEQARAYDRMVDDLEQEAYLRQYYLIKKIKKLRNIPRRYRYRMAKEFRSHEEFKSFMKEMNDIYEDYVIDCGEQSVTSPITEVTSNCHVYQINNEESTTTVAFDAAGRLFTIV